MKELKFRAWDKIRKEWENHFSISKTGKFYRCGIIQNQKNIELVQYTGLKDKNDVEIFEGDVVEFTLFNCYDEDIQCKGSIHIEDGRMYIDSNGDLFNLYDARIQDDEFGVIGNIHENPELISLKT